ncbi:MAG: hypothetical protein ACYTJ0_02095 [Planctomycetota bacterium]
MLTALAAGGCGGPEPPWAVEEPAAAIAELRPEKGRLDALDRARIREAWQVAAGDHEPVRRPAPAPRGIRWEDLPAAVAAACGEVQMAVVRDEPVEGGLRFELRTVDDRPGELTVVATEAAPYYRAEATVGRFRDQDRWADALLAELDRQWRAFGRKKGLE